MNRKSNAFTASRRNFLRLGVAGAGAMALGALSGKDSPFVMPARAVPLPNHKRLVIINMLGGNDGLNMIYPVTGAVATKYQAQRPAIRLMPGSGHALTGGPNVADFELNAALPNLQAMWNADEVALLWKVGYPDENLSHFVSEDIWSWGAREGMASLSGVAPGWIARYANLYAPTAMGVASVGVGRRLDFSGAATSPLLVSSLNQFNFKVDNNYSQNHQLRLLKVQEILAAQPSAGTQGAVAAAQMASIQGTQAVQASIGAHNTHLTNQGLTYPGGLGGRMRDIARIIHGGFETRIFYTGYGGFDTHGDQLGAHANLLGQLDGALNIFRQDMISQGVWNDVMVVVISEFGRRNYQNGSLGTDHGHAIPVIVAGGAVTGGMYGGVTSADMDEEHLPYDTDFRDVYRELIGDHLGNDPAPLFPETQPINNQPNFA